MNINLLFIKGYITKDFLWFRIYKLFIKIKHKKHGLLFSERNAKRRPVKFGNWYVSWGKDN